MHQQGLTRPHSAPSPPTPSKTALLHWIASLLPDLTHCTIQQLGDGEAYCRLINCYAPGSIMPARIIFSPKNDYESALNLKQLQTALTKLRLNLPFDIHRVAKRKFNENWALASQLYRALHHFEVWNGMSESQGKKEVVELPLKASTPKKQIENACKTTKEPFSPSKLSDFPSGSLLFTVDRVKEVLLGRTHDTEKLRMIRVLFGLESSVKMEEGESLYRFES